MSWAALARLDVRIRPLSRPIPCADRYSQFRAPFSRTLGLLARELAHLDAKLIVVEADYRERDLRLDGFPRADARLGSHAIALAFESKYGPLRYETGEYGDWTDNLRAIALSMEALRSVDRYGVSKRGEQYTGWRALPQSTDPVDQIVGRDEAVRVIHAETSDLYDLSDIDGAHTSDAIREALMRSHPDKGGDATRFRKVMRAKKVLDAAA